MFDVPKVEAQLLQEEAQSENKRIMDFVPLGEDANRENRLYRCPYDGDTIKIPKERFYGYCPTCGLMFNDYTPQPHQEQFHASGATLRLNIGGYGSGKTTMACAEIAEHILNVPNGRTAIVANTIDQLRRTVLAELKKMLDIEKDGQFVKRHTKSPLEWTFVNGHELFVLPSDDDTKLRSLNFTAYYMEEASGIDIKVFTQLQARLRNEAGIIRDLEGNAIGSNLMAIINSNAEDGWLVDDVLKYCNKIYATPSVPILSIQSMKREPKEGYEAFMSSTRDNLKHLPPSFISNLIIGKTPQWIARYIDCDIATKEGLVYPTWTSALLEEEIPIPQHWNRLLGYDTGFIDPTAYLIGAINPHDGVIYVYKEYYETQRVLAVHARHLNEDLRGKSLYMAGQLSPELFNRKERTGASDGDYFRGMLSFPIEKANNQIDYGVDKLRDYIDSGKIKFFPSLTNLRNEFRGYVYDNKEIGQKKPIDKNNHLMDALRYMIARLPDNPHELSTGEFNHSMIQNINMERNGSVVGVEFGAHMQYNEEKNKDLIEDETGGVYYYDEKGFWNR